MIAEQILEDRRFSYTRDGYEDNSPQRLPPATSTVEVSVDLTPSIIFELVNLLTLAETSKPEMSDAELLKAAEKTGTFEFWNNSEDDVYNDML